MKIRFRRPRSTYLLFILLFLSLSFGGISKSRESVILLRDALLIDGTGAAPRQHASVLLRDNRIVEVGIDDNIKPPKSARVLDLQGKALLPGFIDVHVHLGASPAGGQHPDETDAKLYPLKLYAYLVNGVTSIRSLGDFDDIYDLRARERRGELISPRIFAVGPIFTAVGGHPNKDTMTIAIDPAKLETMAIRVDSPEKGRSEVERLVRDHHVDAIKIVYTGDNIRLPHLSYDSMAAIVDEGHKAGLRVLIHTDSLQDAKDAVKAGADGVEHGVDIGGVSVDDELLAMMKAKGTYYVPTLAVQENFVEDLVRPNLLDDPLVRRSVPGKLIDYLKDPNGRLQENLKRFKDDRELLARVNKRIETAKQNFHKALAAGVNFAAGTDAGNLLTFYGESEHQELELMVESGATPMQAIQSATLFAARHLGKANDLGTIERGKLADLIVVDGDPTTNISKTRNVQIVIKNGKIINLNNLLTAINPAEAQPKAQ